jgi:thiocyanate hydrolase gamma subunit
MRDHREDALMSGSHDHDDAQARIQARDETVEFDILEATIRELSIAKGLFSADDHRRFMEWYDNIGPTGGSRVVARAWIDPEFKKRLLTDGVAACKEFGTDWMKPTGQGTPRDFTCLIVCENRPRLHNVIVCTLCSCYPRPLLGASPAWYERPTYRRRVVRWPRQVLAEFGLILSPEVEVRVHDSNQKTRYMVLPMLPAGTEGWGEEKLASIVTRDTMFGVAVPDVNWTASSNPAEQNRIS